jgi:hypothetical protein
MTDEHPLTAAEIEAFQRSELFEDHFVSAEDYPRLFNMSAGMIYQMVLRAEAPEPPEYVTVPCYAGHQSYGDDRTLKLSLAITNWNLLWGAMLETCGLAGMGVYLPGDHVESQAMTGVGAPAGKVQPDAHGSPWRGFRPRGPLPVAD